MTNPAPIHPRIAAIADAVNEAVPDPAEGSDLYLRMRIHKSVIMVGCCWELPEQRPSTTELSAAIGCTVSTAQQHLRQWQSWNWQDRYGWIRLIDGRMKSEAIPMDAFVL